MLRFKTVLLIGLLVLLYQNILAQSFSEVANTPIIPVIGSNHQWGDYDNDGDLDLLISGKTTKTSGLTVLYENLGNDSFQIDSSIYFLESRRVYWADFNNDGWLDILMSSGGNSKLFRNNQGGGFSDASDFTINCDYAKCGDYNNDGLIDIATSNYASGSFRIIIYRNAGSYSFAKQDSIEILGGGNGSIDWGDYNNDSYPDLIVCGRQNGTRGRSYIYKNVKGRDFVKVDYDLPKTVESDSKWFDANGDGKLDLFLFGREPFNSLRGKIYKNNGNDNFTLVQSNMGLTICKTSIGDFNNDGDPDIIMQGSTTSMSGHSGSHTPLTRFIKGIQGPGSVYFVNQAHTFPNVYSGDLDLGDYDNDGDLDFILTGSSTTYGNPATNPTPQGKLYKNTDTIQNNPPSTPGGLSVVSSNGNTTLKWNASTDDHATSASLSYNIILGTSSNPTSIYASNSTTNGTRKIVQIGNAGLDTTMEINMAHLSFGTTYYAKVQAIDYSYKGSAFSSSVVVPVRIHADLNDTLTMVCGENNSLPLHVANLDTNITYSWTPSTNLSSTTEANPICSTIQSRYYYVTCTASNGQTYTDSIYVNVDVFNLQISNDTTLVCGNSMQLLATSDYVGGDDNLTWKWSPAAGLSNSNIKNPSLTPYQSNNYIVTATAANGCLMQDTLAITMEPLEVEAPDQTKMCEQDRWVQASHNSKSPSLKYSWSPTDSLKNSFQLNTLTNAIEDMVYVITVTDSTCIAKDTMELTVIPPDYSLDFSSSEVLFTSPPFALQITNLTPNRELYDFEWNMDDSTILNNNNEKFFYQYKYNGTYSPKLTATHKVNKCIDTIAKVDYIYCTGGEHSASVNSSLDLNLYTISPNPTSGALHIKAISKLLGTKYVVYTSNGRDVLSGKLEGTDTRLDLHNLAEGIYLISIGDDVKQIIRVIKE